MPHLNRPARPRFTPAVAGLIASISAVAPWVAAAAEVREPYDTQKSDTRPLSAAEAAARWQFPEGFQVTVFAAEPDVRQPIAMTFDDRGRLWVAESYTYAEVRTGFAEDQRDRIVIFEDRDHDGRFDQRTVFIDGLQRLTSIELGFGGVWALTSPNLVFIADRDGDDRPDNPTTPAVVKLDGFEWKRNHHTVANGLRWGPDGWLYGRHGIQAPSALGAPGTPVEQRAQINGGIWRYHPQRQTVEIVCHGTTNPWGLDWNAQGEPFFINTVIGHLWHVIPGAHYRRMYGNDLVPNIYEVIEQHADHVHWASGLEDWNSWRRVGTTPASSAAGGGHAHTGLLFYSGDNWPAEYRGRLLTINFNGRRLNSDEVVRTPSGSGYVGKHRPDLGFSADPWFRGIDLIEGPDGAVYIADWSDTGECHDDDGVFRNSGRIYKVTHGRAAPPRFDDLHRRTGADLLPMLDLATEFYPRHARRRLQELAVNRTPNDPDVARLRDALLEKFKRATSEIERLRTLWSLYAVGAADAALLRAQLESPQEHVRAWAIRLLVDDPAAVATNAATRSALIARAGTEPSAFVRLALASALQRIPLEDRAALARPLLRQRADAADHNLPAMLWYGIEPLAATNPAQLAELGSICELPLTRRCLSRRLMQERTSPPHQAALAALLKNVAAQPAAHGDILHGLSDALKGQRRLPAPPGWDAVSPAFAANRAPEVQAHFRTIGAVFADPHAAEALRAAAVDQLLSIDERRNALRSLIETRDAKLASVCEPLLATPGLAPTAADGLALESDPALADRVLGQWSRLAAADRGAVLSSLLSRRTWAERVLQAIGDRRVPGTDLTAFHARQIRGFKDPKLDQQLATRWGAARESGAESAARIADWKRRLSPAVLKAADPAHGRAVFKTVCGVCHTLNGEGARIGPELTGSARDNLDYLLSNIVDPSAVVAREYQMVTVSLKDGRALSGLIRSRSADTLTMQTLGETLSLPVGDVIESQESAVSMMPDGLLEALPESDVRALFAYLMKK